MQTRRVLYFCCIASSTVARRTSSSVKFRPHMISTLSVRRFCTPPTIAVASDSWRLFRTFDGDYRSRDLVGRDARIMEPSVERLHDARRRPAFHADDRGQGAGADASDVVPIDVDVLVVAEESLQRRDGIVHRRGGIPLPGRAGGPRPRGPWRPFRLPACGRSVPVRRRFRSIGS